MEIERNLTVISQEGEAIKLNGKISNKCLLFQNILKDSSASEEIPIQAESKIIKIIEKLCENHNFEGMKKIPKPLPHHDLSKIIDEKDFKIISQLDSEEILNLIKTAAYLNCEDVLELGYATVAASLKGKTLDELRAEYDIKEQITPEIEEKLKTNNDIFFEQTRINYEE